MKINSSIPAWDQLAADYDCLYQSEWSQKEDKELSCWLQNFTNELCDYSILDIGCGTGLGYKIMGEIGVIRRYVGVDISNEMLKIFREKFYGQHNFTLLEFDISSGFTKLNGEIFDVMIAINASGSYFMDVRVLRQLAIRHVRTGGRIFISYLNRHSLRRLINFKLGLTERFVSRGTKIRKDEVFAITLSAKKLRSVFATPEFRIVAVRHQSVLGGVWESGYSLKLENILSRWLPFLGHTVNLEMIRL